MMPSIIVVLCVQALETFRTPRVKNNSPTPQGNDFWLDGGRLCVFLIALALSLIAQHVTADWTASLPQPVVGIAIGLILSCYAAHQHGECTSAIGKMNDAAVGQARMQ